MAFYGEVVKFDKPLPQVPHPNPAYNLHLSQACLPATVPKGKRVSLLVNHHDEAPVVIATLIAGQVDSVPLDLFFSEYVEFTLLGDKVEVHITGYYSPAFEPDGDEEDGMPMGMGDDDSDDEGEDDEDEDGEGEEDEDEEGVAGFGRRPNVIIEEVVDEDETITKKGKQLSVNGTAAAMTQMLVDEGDEGEEEDDEGEDDEGEDDEGEDDEEEEEEPQPAPSKAAAKAGTKRQAEAAPAQQQLSKKQQKQQQKEQAAAAKQAAAPAAQAQKQQQGKEAKAGAQAEAAKAGELKTAKKNVRRWENGFEIEEVALGPANGKLAKSGKKVVVHYTGRLKSNGKVFDKSGNKPFSFRLGVGEVIKGWDLGVEGMRVGDKRKLVIPAQLAYGAAGVKGTIPGNSTLEFDVQLVDVK